MANIRTNSKTGPRRVTPFQRVMGRRPSKTGEFGVEVRGKSPTPLDAGALFHYWHPDREGVEPCPEDFARRLAEVSPDLAIVRPPAGAPLRTRCWLVWYRKAEIQHWLSPGWLMLIAWHHPTTNEPLQLDNRILAQLYMQSAKVFGNGKKYFEHIMGIMQSDEARTASANQQHNDDRSHDYYQYQKIKNIGKGNKFACHHDGSVLASRGQKNWDLERGRDLPGDVAARDDDEMKRTRGVAVSELHPAYVKAESLAAMRMLQALGEREQVRELVRAVRQGQGLARGGQR